MANDAKPIKVTTETRLVGERLSIAPLAGELTVRSHLPAPIAHDKQLAD